MVYWGRGYIFTQRRKGAKLGVVYNFGYRVFTGDLLGEGLYFHAKAQRRKVRGCYNFGYRVLPVIYWGRGYIFTQRRKVRGCLQFWLSGFTGDLLGEGLYFHAKAQS